MFEEKSQYQPFDTLFHQQMKHLEVRQKYSSARSIFNSPPGVSSDDETLRLMLDIFTSNVEKQIVPNQRSAEENSFKRSHLKTSNVDNHL